MSLVQEVDRARDLADVWLACRLGHTHDEHDERHGMFACRTRAPELQR